MTTPTLLSIVSKYNMYTHFWCCRTKTYFKYILVLHTNKSHTALYIICNTLILHILNDRKTESLILLSLLCDGFKKYSCTAHCIFWHWILYIASHCICTPNLNWYRTYFHTNKTFFSIVIFSFFIDIPGLPCKCIPFWILFQICSSGWQSKA